MYIQPNTNLRFIKNCPLDKDYRNTIYFNLTSQGKTDQYNYFNSLVKPTMIDTKLSQTINFSLTNQSYTRASRNSIRVAIPCDDLYDCNYMMFQNFNYTNKWFYAFVDSVEYVNNATSEVFFTIDVLQTWHFDYSFGECFIDREHQATDVAGDNLLPESVDLGELVYNGQLVIDEDGLTTPLKHKIAFLCTFTYDSESGVCTDVETGRVVNGVYSGLYYIDFLSETSANTFLYHVIQQNKIDGVIACYMLPTTLQLSGQTGNTKDINIQKPTTLGSYTPRNKKLLTYPYCFYRVQTDTNVADFKYEYFLDANNATFYLESNVYPAPYVSLAPTNYKDLTTGQAVKTKRNIGERLSLTNYPQCAFNSDIFKVYLAQNAASLPVKMIGSAVNAVPQISYGAMTQNPIQVAGGFLGVASELASLADLSSKAPQMNGTQSSESDYPQEFKHFFGRKMHLNAQYSSIIDQYFDMYGYKSHKVKAPNRKVRKYWTFTKTIGCDIHNESIFGTGLPSDDVETIQRIFNSGVTWWNYYVPTGETFELGNYSAHMGADSTKWNTVI